MIKPANNLKKMSTLRQQSSKNDYKLNQSSLIKMQDAEIKISVI